jgi:uncharacterized membrane protein
VVHALQRLGGRSPPHALIGLGGAVTNLVAVQHALVPYDPEVVRGATLDRAEVERQIELYRSRGADARRQIPGLQPQRAEVILAGACIVRGVLELLGRDALQASDRGLRHGLVVARFPAPPPSPTGRHASPTTHTRAPLPPVRADRRLVEPNPRRRNTMSTLVAIAYPDAATAERVRGELIQATKEHLLDLEDAVVVEHQPDGKIKLHQAMSTTGAGAAGGALWGGLIGLIFLAPLFGMAIGAASGALAGKVSDPGVNDNFMKELGAQMPPGGAALIALGRSDAPNKVIDRVKSYGGHVIQTSLDEDAEERLRVALGEQATVA